VETVNSQYSVARPDSLPIKLAGYQRRKMFTVFLSASGIAPDDYAEKSLGYGYSSRPPAWLLVERLTPVRREIEPSVGNRSRASPAIRPYVFAANCDTSANCGCMTEAYCHCDARRSRQ
jgi:hypothetical protein